MNKAKCEHEFEPCEFDVAFSGAKWMQIASVHFCPKCQGFGTKTHTFIDGDFHKEADVPAIQKEQHEEFEKLKTEWLEKRTAGAAL